MALSLVPEIIDPVDVVPIFRKGLRVVDADVSELRDVQHIVAAEAIGAGDTVRLDLA